MARMHGYIALIVYVGLVMTPTTYADNIDKNAQIRNFNNDAADAEGNYQYGFDTSNGIQVQAAGNQAGETGAFNYVSPEGERISLSYTADEEGFHPIGDHLPTPPPMPAYVLRALEYIRLHPPAQIEEQQ